MMVCLPQVFPHTAHSPGAPVELYYFLQRGEQV